MAAMSQEPLHFTRRPHRDGDDTALLDLLIAAFGRWPKVEIQCEPIDHLRWKTAAPASADLHRITEVDGQIASSVFCWIQQVKLRDGAARNIQGTDRVVHPAFQERGLAEAITRWRRRHMDEQPCEFQFSVRSGHPALQRIAKRFDDAITLGNPIQVLEFPQEKVAASIRASLSMPGIIRSVACFDDRCDAFFARAAEPFDFIIERSQEYMNWRYADPRAGLFSIRFAEEGSELRGYAVVRRSHGRGYIADLLALPGRLDIAAALLDDALSLLAAADVSTIDCWLPFHHPYRPLLLERGFLLKRELGFDIYLHNPALDIRYLADQDTPVHVSAGDTDLV
jgi:hypothetical protein